MRWISKFTLAFVVRWQFDGFGSGGSRFRGSSHTCLLACIQHLREQRALSHWKPFDFCPFWSRILDSCVRWCQPLSSLCFFLSLVSVRTIQLLFQDLYNTLLSMDAWKRFTFVGYHKLSGGRIIFKVICLEMIACAFSSCQQHLAGLDHQLAVLARSVWAPFICWIFRIILKRFQ